MDEVEEGPRFVAVVETPVCRWCGNRAILEVDLERLRLWENGMLITEAFPDLDADQRELLISGTHAHCWDAMWSRFDDGELRSCDECGEVEDAGEFPDQDNGRCAECAERNG